MGSFRPPGNGSATGWLARGGAFAGGRYRLCRPSDAGRRPRFACVVPEARRRRDAGPPAAAFAASHEPETRAVGKPGCWRLCGRLGRECALRWAGADFQPRTGSSGGAAARRHLDLDAHRVGLQPGMDQRRGGRAVPRCFFTTGQQAPVGAVGHDEQRPTTSSSVAPASASAAAIVAKAWSHCVTTSARWSCGHSRSRWCRRPRCRRRPPRPGIADLLLEAGAQEMRRRSVMGLVLAPVARGFERRAMLPQRGEALRFLVSTRAALRMTYQLSRPPRDRGEEQDDGAGSVAIPATPGWRRRCRGSRWRRARRGGCVPARRGQAVTGPPQRSGGGCARSGGNLPSFPPADRARHQVAAQWDRGRRHLLRAQSTHQVHSKEQISASRLSGGRSRPQHSQLGRSFSIVSLLAGMGAAACRTQEVMPGGRHEGLRPARGRRTGPERGARRLAEDPAIGKARRHHSVPRRNRCLSSTTMKAGNPRPRCARPPPCRVRYSSTSTFLIAVLRQPRRRAAHRAEIEAAMLLAGIAHRLGAVPLASIKSSRRGLEGFHIAVHAPRRGRPKEPVA